MNIDDRKKIYELGKIEEELSLEEKLKVVNKNYIQSPDNCKGIYQSNLICNYKHGCSYQMHYAGDKYCLLGGEKKNVSK